MKPSDLEPGMRFGRLKTLAFSYRDRKNCFWACLCDCGKITVTRASRLFSGTCKSCGCLVVDTTKENSFKHGHYAKGNITFMCWWGMMQRCFNDQNKSFENYGARGITVCEEWKTYEGFIKDMGERPSKNHSIGRIDNNGNYELINCRWETRIQQANNTRANRIETFRGVTDTITQLSRMNGLDPYRVVTRLHSGWTVDEALSTPINSNKHRKAT